MDLNPRFRFETFVVGATNRLAATAAQTVASSPGAVYNPLVLYARSGLGKTHLLHAIGFSVQEAQAAGRVRYLTLEEFVEQYHAAVAAGQVDAFRKSAEETEVLLLDDIQFLTKHREMQAELLRLSERMHVAGRQLVLTSDRAPAEIPELDERLISRFTGGLLVDIAAPDLETRVAILRRKAEERGVSFAPGVLEMVAELVASNVRELVGLVNRLLAFQAVSDAPLTPEGARALLAGEGTQATASPAAAGAAAAPSVPAGAGGPAAPTAPAEAERGDEFTAFLSAITRTVAQSLDSWRARIGEAVMRWQGEGYRTVRLEHLLMAEDVPDADQVLARFTADVEELKRLAAEVAELDPRAAGHARFRDPDRVEEVRAFAARMREGLVPPPAPSPALSLDDYVVGTSNEVAVRAARLVVAEPGKRYTPLFIVGPSGVGKTHLLNAIGNGLAARPGPPVVACLSALSFFEELVAAIDGEHVEWWRTRYRRADALLVDDVQLLAGKEHSQDELFNLFNALGDAGRQLVFSADRPPARLEGIVPRLVTRFEGGLVVELAAPDRLMRAAMVRRLLDGRGVPAEDDAVQYLAARPADSARAVQGIVNRALSAMDGSEPALTLAVARSALEGRTSRPSQEHAISAFVPAGLDPALTSREKLLWDWPDATERLWEELR